MELVKIADNIESRFIVNKITATKITNAIIRNLIPHIPQYETYLTARTNREWKMLPCFQIINLIKVRIRFFTAIKDKLEHYGLDIFYDDSCDNYRAKAYYVSPDTNEASIIGDTMISFEDLCNAPLIWGESNTPSQYK